MEGAPEELQAIQQSRTPVVWVLDWTAPTRQSWEGAPGVPPGNRPAHAGMNPRGRNCRAISFGLRRARGDEPHREHRGTHKSNLLIGVKISSTPAVFISETDRPPMRGSAYRSRLRIQFCA